MRRRWPWIAALPVVAVGALFGGKILRGAAPPTPASPDPTVSATAATPTQDAPKGVFSWVHGRFSSSELELAGATMDGRLSFSVKMWSGLDMGLITGSLSTAGDGLWRYRDGECSIELRRDGAGFEMTSSPECVDMFAYNTRVEHYEPGPPSVPPLPAPGARAIDVNKVRARGANYEDPEVQGFLRTHLGEEGDERLAVSMMLVSTISIGDNAHNAIAWEGCVRGGCSFVVSFVRIEPNGSGWVAVLDKDGSEVKAFVYRPPAWRRRPADLEAWLLKYAVEQTVEHVAFD